MRISPAFTPRGHFPVCALALSLLSAMTSGSVQAQSSHRPFWTQQAMFRFGEQLYFVGVASCARTPEEGRTRAFENALTELRHYLQDRDTSRLLVATQMIYEEPNSPACPIGSTSVWRLLRVDESKLAFLPRRESKEADQHPPAASELPPVPERQEPVAQDLTPQIGMSRGDIIERFGSPDLKKKEGRSEVWQYSDIGLTITFSPEETLFDWKFEGIPTAEVPLPEQTPISLHNEPATIASLPSPFMPVPALPPPLQPEDPITRGRKLFNGKGGCNLCHGRDADMFTDIAQDMLYGSPPGYLPPLFTPLGGLSPRRVPPNLRDWSALKLRTDLEMARAIKNGIAGTTMTATRHLNDAEISALVDYLNSIR